MRGSQLLGRAIEGREREKQGWGKDKGRGKAEESELVSWELAGE